MKLRKKVKKSLKVSTLICEKISKSFPNAFYKSYLGGKFKRNHRQKLLSCYFQVLKYEEKLCSSNDARKVKNELFVYMKISSS